MLERKLGPSWVDSLGLLAIITVLLTISRKTEKSEWFLTWRGCFLGGSGKDRIKGLVRTRLCPMTLSELLSSFSFLQFLLWMLKFPHLAPFSVQGTSLLQCRGSRRRLLLSSPWTTGKPQLLQSELCTGFRSWSGHGQWLCLASSSAPTSGLPEAPQRASVEIEELDFICKFPNRNTWRVYFTISIFLQDLFTEERNVVYTNAGAWHCAWELERRSTLPFFLSHAIQSFQATTTTSSPSQDLGPVACTGSILCLCGLKPHDSLLLWL